MTLRPENNAPRLREKLQSASRVGRALKSRIKPQTRAELRAAAVSEAIRDYINELNAPVDGTTPFSTAQANILHDLLLDSVRGLDKSLVPKDGFSNRLAKELSEQTAWEKVRNFGSAFAMLVGCF